MSADDTPGVDYFRKMEDKGVTIFASKSRHMSINRLAFDLNNSREYKLPKKLFVRQISGSWLRAQLPRSL